MIHPPANSPANAGPTSLIDTLQAGFNTINRHLWLLLLPLLVDLLLWLGPQLTVGSAVTDWVNGPTPATSVAGGLERFLGEDGIPSRPGDELQRYNLFWLLAVPFLGIPSFRAGITGNGATVPMDSLPGVAVAIGVILTIGVSLAVLYYGLLAQVVRSGTSAVLQFPGEFGTLWIRALALFVITLAAALVLAVPVAFLLAGTVSTAPALLTLVASLVLGVFVWLFVHLFFTPDALFVGVVGPISAVRRSISIVRHFFWESIVFVGLIVVITSGFPIIFHEVARNLQTAGMILAIIGHIYISTSVTAASMTYYRERFDRLNPSPAR